MKNQKNYMAIWQIYKKSLNFEPVQPEMGQTQAQIRKNQTSNPSEPRFVYQNRTTNNQELLNRKVTPILTSVSTYKISWDPEMNLDIQVWPGWLGKSTKFGISSN